jgi:hypothetical protein
MTNSAEATIAQEIGRGRNRAGAIMFALAVLFLLFDGAARVVAFAPYVAGTVHAGFSAEDGVWIGLLLIASTLLYAVPRTTYLGAILLTGYLGAATATNLRVGDPFIFPFLFGVWIWAALYLMDPRLASLFKMAHR